MTQATSGAIVRDLPYPDYAKREGVNATALEAGRVSMRHMHHAMTQSRPDTPAMRMGRLIHAAILEPERFSANAWAYAGRKHGAKWDEACDGHDPDWCVSVEQLSGLVHIAARVNGDKHAQELLDGTEREVSAFWNSPRYGFCKARFDAVRVKGSGCGQIVDIKSTARVSPNAFSRTAANLGYHVKLGWYQIASEAVFGVQFPAVHIICIEQGEPHDCVVYRVPQPVLDHGREIAEDVAMQYKVASVRGEYPGVSDEIETLDFPVWAMPEQDLDFEGCE
jgi:exodeoxyribonuclease VIII